jgi:hypothetical protein
LSRCEIRNIDNTQLDAYTIGSIGGAVAIKSAWQVLGNANNMPGSVGQKEMAYFDTSASGLAANLEKGEWTPAGMVDPATLQTDQIYTMETIKAGKQLRHGLTGLHILTKDRKDWVWITLWWSPNPDEDFGADRPADLPNVNSGAWKNYKMCVVVDYTEWDRDPTYGIQDESLRNAIMAAHTFQTDMPEDGPSTWCSNPYVEHGLGNTRTNCIGCHQHAGSKENPQNVFLDDPSDPNNFARRQAFPNNGRARVRNNFPSDYLWSFSSKPDFFNQAILQAIEEVRSERL